MLIDKIKKYPRDVITDERGWFLKIMTGTEEFSNNICEIYFTSAHKNQSKGSHFHNMPNYRFPPYFYHGFWNNTCSLT